LLKPGTPRALARHFRSEPGVQCAQLALYGREVTTQTPHDHCARWDSKPHPREPARIGEVPVVVLWAVRDRVSSRTAAIKGRF
jgi:hypothetical protein